MSRTANYEIIRNHRHTRASTYDALVIRDLGPHDQFLTVTNAAEQVCKELFASGDLVPDQPLFYIDSDGSLDEMKHSSGVFMGFAPGPEGRQP